MKTTRVFSPHLYLFFFFFVTLVFHKIDVRVLIFYCCWGNFVLQCSVCTGEIVSARREYVRRFSRCWTPPILTRGGDGGMASTRQLSITTGGDERPVEPWTRQRRRRGEPSVQHVVERRERFLAQALVVRVTSVHAGHHESHPVFLGVLALAKTRLTVTIATFGWITVL